MLVGWIDSLQSVDCVEGAIRREDRIYAPVDSQGGIDCILGIEALVGLEKVDSPLNVVGLDRVPPDEPRDASRSFRRTQSIASSTRSLVRELLKQVDAGLALKIAHSG